MYDTPTHQMRTTHNVLHPPSVAKQARPMHALGPILVYVHCPVRPSHPTCMTDRLTSSANSMSCIRRAVPRSRGLRLPPASSSSSCCPVSPPSLPPEYRVRCCEDINKHVQHARAVAVPGGCECCTWPYNRPYPLTILHLIASLTCCSSQLLLNRLLCSRGAG
jgi:hypothetical protein